MPFVFAILGVLFLVVAVRGTQGDAFTLIRSEFTGNNSFLVFASAIAVLGALAFIKPIRKPAWAMIGLVLLGMILADKGGFFAQFNNALRNPVAPTQTQSSPALAFNPASTTLQTAPSSALSGVQNPYLAQPSTPLQFGVEPPATGGGFGQY